MRGNIDESTIVTYLPKGFRIKKFDGYFSVEYFKTVTFGYVALMIALIVMAVNIIVLIKFSANSYRQVANQFDMTFEEYLEYTFGDKEVPEVAKDEIKKNYDNTYVKTRQEIAQKLGRMNDAQYYVSAITVLLMVFISLFRYWVRRRVRLFPDKIIYKTLLTEKEVLIASDALVKVRARVESVRGSKGRGRSYVTFYDLVACHHGLEEKLFDSQDKDETEKFSEVMNEWIQKMLKYDVNA